MLASVNGHPLISARVTIPMRGAWIYDGETPGDSPITEGPVTLTIAEDMMFTGTIVRVGQFAGRTRFRAVGGGSGWTARVTPRGYTQPSGLMLAPLVADAAREAGEILGPVPSVSVGTQYTRRQGPASQVFALLPAGVDWWVDLSGVTQFGERASGLTTAAFQTMDFDGAAGVATIATDAPSQFAPGRRFVDPIIGERAINVTVWRVDETTLRGELWT